MERLVAALLAALKPLSHKKKEKKKAPRISEASLHKCDVTE